jgi:hypothetical protein
MNTELLYDGKRESEFEVVNKRVDRPVDSFYYTSGAGFIIPEGIRSGKYEHQFRAKMKRAGLMGHQIDILVHTFIYEDSSTETAEALGMTAANVIKYRAEAMKFLKKKKYGLRRRR